MTTLTIKVKDNEGKWVDKVLDFPWINDGEWTNFMGESRPSTLKGLSVAPWSGLFERWCKQGGMDSAGAKWDAWQLDLDGDAREELKDLVVSSRAGLQETDKVREQFKSDMGFVKRCYHTWDRQNNGEDYIDDALGGILN